LKKTIVNFFQTREELKIDKKMKVEKLGWKSLWRRMNPQLPYLALLMMTKC